MSLQKNLQKYARLTVQAGMNVQKGQILVIDAAVESVELVRLITKEAYEIGAKEVVVRYNDEEVSKLKYQYADKELFGIIPRWVSDFENDYAQENAAFLTIVSNDPEGYKGIDPTKISLWSASFHKACQPFFDSLDLGINTWCIIGASSVKWANKVFPDMSDDEAVEALWNAIFKATKVDNDNPVEAWQNHRRSFEKRIKYLNELKLDSLTYTNSLGTNITIGLNKDYIFAGGGAATTKDIYFFPNMPTEEIFTTPSKDRADGIVYSSLPLNHNGNLINEFYLEFKDGRIVDYGAKEGLDVLKEIIEMDEGSHHLGEIALIPYDSPISNMDTLFYNTLFDENASCHFAIGKGFAECIKDGLTMNKEQLFEKGVNDSLTHVDFMLGTADLEIHGKTTDGKDVKIFTNGNFVF